MKKRKLLLLLGAVLILLVPLFYFVVSPAMKGYALKMYLNTPTSKTIYERNNNNFPKTKIDIPEHEGYLLAVYKDAHKLQIIKNNALKAEYDVNIKRENMDRKVWEDDQTPEGIFYIESMDKIFDPPWSRWMRLDTAEKAHEIYKEAYPDGETRIREFEEEYGPLDNDQALRQFNEINPDQKILRGIGIHGGGFSIYHEWTNGCIAMSDEDVIELFDILGNSQSGGIGTMVVIQD